VITALILVCALLMAGAAAAFAAWRLLFRDGGGHAAPRPHTQAQRIGQLPGIRAFRS
jgi:hypothetical protein